ncbi:class I SAM-dependent methyltransferase [Nakamurella sp. GG22]
MSAALDRLFTRWYPLVMGRSERAGQSEIRREQLSLASGRTLEVGAGSGLSVPYYGDDVTELVLVEPDADFRIALQVTIDDLTPAPWPVTVVDADAQRLPFDDATFDTVTASFTFCSLQRPEIALDELHRVLRQGGRFLFHEHVRGHGPRARFQDLMTPVQVLLAGGCHPNRDFVGTLRRSPFRIDQVVPDRMPRAFPTVTPVVHGTASRQAQHIAISQQRPERKSTTSF